MYSHPDLVLANVKSHQDDLIAEARRARLLHRAREWRAATRAESQRAAERRRFLEAADRIAAVAPVAATPMSALVGTLATCSRDAVGSAR